MGPADLVTPVSGAPAGTFYTPPRNINVRIRCLRTALAAANGRSHQQAVRVYAGLFDVGSVRCTIGGEAQTGFEILNAPPNGFGLPLMALEPDFVALGAGASSYDYLSADKAYRVTFSSMNMSVKADGTFTMTLDNTYRYAVGQKVRFFYNSDFGGGPVRILRFPKTGAGMLLGADRNLRRAGEYLDLEWNGAVWLEAGVLEQGA